MTAAIVTESHIAGALLVIGGVASVVVGGLLLLGLLHRYHPPDPRPRVTSTGPSYDEVARQRLAREARYRAERRHERDLERERGKLGDGR